ncbi:MAG: beta-propeller domain-containing protein [Thalassolituus sp.]
MKMTFAVALNRAVLILSASGLLTGCYGAWKEDISEIEGQPLEVYLKEGLLDSYQVTIVNSCPECSNDVAAESDASDYSETNVQEAGVDEADLVKQNGAYIYSAGQFYDETEGAYVVGMTTHSVSTNPLASQLESTNYFTSSYNVNGLYLNGDSLIALSEEISGSTYEYITEIRFLNLNNPALPEETLKLGFTGNLLDSRLINNNLYLAVRYRVSKNRALGENLIDVQSGAIDVASLSEEEKTDLMNEISLEDLLPQVWKNDNATGYLFEDGLCHIPDADQGGYLSIISVIRINIDDPDDWEAKCNSGRIHDVYASTNAFILAGYNSNDWDTTRLDWYALDDFRLIATGSVPGTLSWSLPSFRMSEKDGVLRILTSSSRFSFWDSVSLDDVDEVSGGDVDVQVEADASLVIDNTAWQHRLFTIAPTQENTYRLVSQLPNNERKEIIGKPGEDVRSVRFRGDRAYVVTFMQTDPLYVINLEDEDDPFVEGELEITGFSSYLHPLNNNLLLGLGYEATETGRRLGLKISLFDVSDPADPTEVRSYPLGDTGSYTEALYDNRASSYLQIDESTTRMAFTWRHYSEDYTLEGNKVFVADIDTANVTLAEKLNRIYENNSRYWLYSSRVLLQEDGLHLINNGQVTSGPIDSISFE